MNKIDSFNEKAWWMKESMRQVFDARLNLWKQKYQIFEFIFGSYAWFWYGLIILGKLAIILITAVCLYKLYMIKPVIENNHTTYIMQEVCRMRIPSAGAH